MNYQHKGVTITLTEGGRFKATINGKEVTKDSMVAIKKQIDAGVAGKLDYLPPMKAYTLYGNRFGRDADGPFDESEHEVEVLRLDKARNSGMYHFCLSTGRHDATVLPCTPEALNALRAYCEYAAETRRISVERRANEEKMRMALPWIRASDEARKKGV